MLEQIRQDLLSILKDGIQSIKENNSLKLRDLSNQTIHNSSIFQDEEAITIAIIMYALNKIFQRTSYKEYNDWKLFYKITLESLEKSEKFLQEKDFENYKLEIKKILNVIDKLSSHLKTYVKEVFQESHVAKASRLYEHGLSIGRTAELFGISKWELMSYTGETGIHDMDENKSESIEERIKFTRGLFK